MTSKRCNHCKMPSGIGWELLLGEILSCPHCGCMWQADGYHLGEGIIDGQRCAYPQPQAWRSTPDVQAQPEAFGACAPALSGGASAESEGKEIPSHLRSPDSDRSRTQTKGLTLV